MNYQDFRGLGPALTIVREEGVSAYLFLGERGTGKRSIASIRVRAQNCTGARKPCDECGSCKRYLAGTHPDAYVLASEKSIGVNEIRILIDKVSKRPFEGGSHTVIIENADKMTQQAQNALLKTLETPPSSVLFILIAENGAMLLPTVISRCKVVRFPCVSEDHAAQVLRDKGYDAQKAQLLARLSGGAVGKALLLEADETYWDIRDRTFKALKMLSGADSVADCAMIFKNDKDNARRVLDAFEQHARDLLVLAESENLVMQRDRIQDLRQLSIDGAKMLQSVFEARKRLSSNVAWQYTSEMLFYEILEDKNT